MNSKWATYLGFAIQLVLGPITIFALASLWDRQNGGGNTWVFFAATGLSLIWFIGLSLRLNKKIGMK